MGYGLIGLNGMTAQFLVAMGQDIETELVLSPNMVVLLVMGQTYNQSIVIWLNVLVRGR